MNTNVNLKLLYFALSLLDYFVLPPSFDFTQIYTYINETDRYKEWNTYDNMFIQFLLALSLSLLQNSDNGAKSNIYFLYYQTLFE